MKTIRVWDLLVRIFHWALVGAIIVQLITAESFQSLHARVGYASSSCCFCDSRWGFIGTRHARFKDFIYPPAEIFSYLNGLIRRRPKHYLGHNPAGGAMVFCLLFILAIVTVTGLMTYGAEGKGPLALTSSGPVAVAAADGGHDHDHDHADAGEKGHFWKSIHETLVGFLIFLACVHVCGVVASSFVHKENLILAMITGQKKCI